MAYTAIDDIARHPSQWLSKNRHLSSLILQFVPMVVMKDKRWGVPDLQCLHIYSLAGHLLLQCSLEVRIGFESALLPSVVILIPYVGIPAPRTRLKKCRYLCRALIRTDSTDRATYFSEFACGQQVSITHDYTFNFCWSIAVHKIEAICKDQKHDPHSYLDLFAYM